MHLHICIYVYERGGGGVEERGGRGEGVEERERGGGGVEERGEGGRGRRERGEGGGGRREREGGRGRREKDVCIRGFATSTSRQHILKLHVKAPLGHHLAIFSDVDFVLTNEDNIYNHMHQVGSYLTPSGLLSYYQ